MIRSPHTPTPHSNHSPMFDMKLELHENELCVARVIECLGDMRRLHHAHVHQNLSHPPYTRARPHARPPWKGWRTVICVDSSVVSKIWPSALQFLNHASFGTVFALWSDKSNLGSSSSSSSSSSRTTMRLSKHPGQYSAPCTSRSPYPRHHKSKVSEAGVLSS